MSVFELMVVMIVALLVVKPEDLPKIIAKFKEIRAFVTNTKKEIIAQIIPDDKESVNLEQDMEQMNFYLAKIVNLGSEYQGEYTITSVKDHYHQLVKEKIKIGKNED